MLSGENIYLSIYIYTHTSSQYWFMTVVNCSALTLEAGDGWDMTRRRLDGSAWNQVDTALPVKVIQI